MFARTCASSPRKLEYKGLISDLASGLCTIITEIGEYKREHSMPVVQEGRYRALMEERIAEAAGLGLSEAFMRGLFQAVHAESVRLQLP